MFKFLLAFLAIANCQSSGTDSNTTVGLNVTSQAKPCPDIFVCLDFWQPVCASDGITYSNECYMERESCEHNRTLTVVHKGECD